MDKYREEIMVELKQLTREKKVLFGIITSLQLFSNYKSFEEKENWGNSRVLELVIENTYQRLFSLSFFNKEDIHQQIERVESITPDTEDFSSILVSFALDACTSVISTLLFILDNNDEHIADVAIYARDTVDMYIQEKDDLSLIDKDLEEYIENSQFMQIEKAKRKQLIREISLLNNLDFGNIQRFKTEPIIDLTLL